MLIFTCFVRSCLYRVAAMPFYSVARGRQTGVFTSWPDCQAQVKGFSGPIFKKFNTKFEAEEHVRQNGGTLSAGLQPSATVTTSNYRLPGMSAHIGGGSSGCGSSYGGGSGSGGSSSKSNTLKRARPDELSEEVSTTASPELDSKRPRTIGMKTYGRHSFLEDADGFVHVYTDGSCEGNGQKKAVAGLGVYFADGHALNTALPVSGRATNNCGEIQAASTAIRLAAENGVPNLCVLTDSKFLIDSATKWMAGWKKRGWKLASGGPVKNEKDFKELDSLLQDNKQMKVKWTYVKAHVGIHGNERADELARKGGQMYREEGPKK